MQLTAIGLNHQTAPLSIRERLAFAAAALPEALRELVGSRTAEEAVILSTCNRTELYCVGEPDDIVRWLANYRKIPNSTLEPYLYRYQTEAAVRHAFRVSCGLDSMVLGEPQILGQIKNAVRVAQEQQTVASTLHALFQKTFAIAKEVRTSTAVGGNSVSMAAAAVKMAARIFPDIGELNILFVGAEEMIELVATHFAAKSPRGITVANRTAERAQELCNKLAAPAAACPLSELPQRLHQYDVIVSSTASQLPIIGKGMVERALRERRHRPVFLLDLAVPRDIEAEVAARQRAAAEAEQMVDSKVAEFMSWQRRRQSVPLIRSLRDEGERARQQVLDNATRLLAKGVPAEEVLERLSVQLTNKLLHAPTSALSKVDNQTAHLTEALVQVYSLDKPRS